MPLPQVVVDQLLRNAVRMLSDGNSKEHVIDHLTSNGIFLNDALNLVNEAQKLKLKVVRAHGKSTILYGITLIILGIIITVGFHSLASGGYYVITVGIFLGGIIIFFKGIWSMIVQRRIS